MCQKCHQCFILLEPIIASANVNLPESNRIRNSTVTSVMVPRSGSATLYGKNGSVIAPDAVIQSSYLILKNANGTEIATLPLAHLQRDFNGPEPLCVKYLNIDPTQCAIIVNTGAAGYAVTQTIPITFGLDCDDCGIS